jgi:hypothetical protein
VHRILPKKRQLEPTKACWRRKKEREGEEKARQVDSGYSTFKAFSVSRHQ